MENDRIELRRKRDFGATINVVFEFVRKNWRPLGKSLLLIVGPILLVASVIGGFYVRNLLGLVGDLDGSPMTNPLAVLSSIGPFVLLSLVSGVLSTIFLFGVVSGYVRRYVEQAPEPIEVDDVWSELKSSFWTVTATFIVAMIITALPMLILALPALLLNEPILFLLILFGFVPSIYFWIVLTIQIPMRVEEEIGLFASMRRCMYLMKGRWWFSFWISVVMIIVVTLISFVFQIPIQVALAISRVSGTETSVFIIFAGVALSTIGSYMLYSLLILTFSVLYYNLVEHKEGIGMAERISEIGADVAPETGTTRVTI